MPAGLAAGWSSASRSPCALVWMVNRYGPSFPLCSLDSRTHTELPMSLITPSGCSHANKTLDSGTATRSTPSRSTKSPSPSMRPRMRDDLSVNGVPLG